MDPDRSGTVEIRSSPWAQLRLAGVGVIMTAASAFAALPRLSNVAPGSFTEFAGYVGVLFFGLATLVFLWRAVSLRGAVIRLTREGILDRRVAAEVIPWRAIGAISTWESHKQRIIVLAVDPQVERRLTLTRMARWTRGANARLGADGLCIAVGGLKVDYDELLALCRSYAAASRSAQ